MVTMSRTFQVEQRSRTERRQPRRGEAEMAKEERLRARRRERRERAATYAAAN